MIKLPLSRQLTEAHTSIPSKKDIIYLLYSFKIILLKTSFATTLKDSIISYVSASGNFSIERKTNQNKGFLFLEDKISLQFIVSNQLTMVVNQGS